MPSIAASFTAQGSLESVSADPLHGVTAAMKRHWGYDEFRPLQREAMTRVVEGGDSVVVLPTGGGKSLCFQAPAASMPGTAIVVSPLISLMKDQVDALRACGVPAAMLNSSLDPEARRAAAGALRRGELKLLYVAPERLLLEGFLDFVSDIHISFVAIDEAHCISSWGHDFRPEYRGLSLLRRALPGVALHAYTATATERVRGDIAVQLALHKPAILVGPFDRANLFYRVRERSGVLEQVMETVRAYPGESGIVYCPTRKKVDELAADIVRRGVRALPYHAGLDELTRRNNQDAFLRDRCDVVVATIAFGMGIDKSNVRFVVHTSMPPSIENYLQESGRAGRDGLMSECCMLFSHGDYMISQRHIEDLPAESREGARQKLDAMKRYCYTGVCRHKYLVAQLGQQGLEARCKSCDICVPLGPKRSRRGKPEKIARGAAIPKPLSPAAALVVGQKIASCAVRLDETADAAYLGAVLRAGGGAVGVRIAAAGHHLLSTFGILGEASESAMRGWIAALLAQGFLSEGPQPGCAIAVTEPGWQMLRGERTPELMDEAGGESPELLDDLEAADGGPFEQTSDVDETTGAGGLDTGAIGNRRKRRERAARRDIARALDGEGAEADGADDGRPGAEEEALFQELRKLRREIADELSVPAFVVFSDAVLRELARVRPQTMAQLPEVHGIGVRKAEAYGPRYLALLTQNA